MEYLELERDFFSARRTKRANVRLGTAITFVVLALVATLVSPLTLPTVTARSCGVSNYQSSTASVATHNGNLQYMEVDMRKATTWNGYTCVDVIHFMQMYTIAPAYWTVQAGGTIVHVDLKVSLPSWSTFESVGLWQYVSYNDYPLVVTADSGTGAGYSTAGWTGELYLCCSATDSLPYGPTYSHTWSSTSGHYGQNYVINFVMQDNPPYGIIGSTTLTMTA